VSVIGLDGQRLEVLDGPPALAPAAARMLRRGLRRRSRVGMAIADLTRLSVAPPASVGLLVSAVLERVGFSPRERAAACGALGAAAVGPGVREVAAEALGEALAGGIGMPRKRTMGRSLLIAAVIGAPIAIALFQKLVLGRGWFFAGSALDWAVGATAVTCSLGVGIAAVLWPIVAALTVLRDRAMGVRVRVAAADALGDLAEPASVAPIARALKDLTPSVRRAAWGALPRVLGKLDDRHYGHVERDTVPALCRALGKGPEAADLAILEALGHVGGTSAVEPVERMAGGARWASVRDAAQRILPILRDRRRVETDTTRLLRPAQPNNANHLLRPVEAGPSSDVSTLVRPSE